MVEKIKKICFDIATLGGIGEIPAGGLVATLVSVPLLFILKAFSWLGPTFFALLVILITVFVLSVIHLALHYQTDKDSSVIVIDRLFGCLIVFLSIPISIKVLVIGFLLFNFFNFLSPFLWYKLGNINLEELPGVLGIIASDLVVGVVLNILFRLILWIAR